jgi:hypothetical protein
MLAGLLLMTGGNTPGRPPGAKLQVANCRRAAAGSKSQKCHLKEIAMKHLIIAATVSLGLIAQSSEVSIDRQTNQEQSIAAIASNPQSDLQQLSAQEMTATIGGENITGCWEYIDIDGDKHAVCCVDLWIFSVCFGVNVSAVERLINSL